MNERNTKLDDWLTAARNDVANLAPEALAEHQLLVRAREVWALQSIATARADHAPPIKRTHRAAGGVRFWRRWSFRLPVALAAAALIGMGFVLLAPPATEASAGAGSPFFSLVAPEAMAAQRSAVLVASQVSGAALADYGLPLDPARVDEPIAAEFLLSPAGVVLAVRFTE